MHSQSIIKNIFFVSTCLKNLIILIIGIVLRRLTIKNSYFFLFKFVPIIQICFNHFYTIQGAKFFWVWSETMCHDTKHRFWRIHDLWVRGSFFNQWKMHMSASVYGKFHDHYVMENAFFITFRFQTVNITYFIIPI